MHFFRVLFVGSLQQIVGVARGSKMGGKVVLPVSCAAAFRKSFRINVMTLVYESDPTDLRTSQGEGLSKQEPMKFTSDLLRYRFDEQKMSVTAWLVRQIGIQSK